MTRNAVIGKARRMNLAKKNNPPLEKSAPATDRGARRVLAERKDFIPKPQIRRSPARGVPFASVNLDRQCRWPLDSGMYCGARATHGVYCEAHHKMAYVQRKAQWR